MEKSVDEFFRGRGTWTERRTNPKHPRTSGTSARGRSVVMSEKTPSRRPRCARDSHQISRPNFDYDFRPRVACFGITKRIRDFAQRVGPVNDGLYLSRGHQVCDSRGVRDSHPADEKRNAAAEDRQSEDGEGTHCYRGPVFRGAGGNVSPLGRQQTPACRDGAVPDVVEKYVEAPRGAGEILLRVIDDLV